MKCQGVVIPLREHEKTSGSKNNQSENRLKGSGFDFNKSVSVLTFS